MANDRTKTEMEEALKVGFATNNIKKKRTRIGRDVIVRVGDPTKTHDLVRVNAHRATSIAIMMTKQDEHEAAFSGGRTTNSATLRCLLAVRNIIMSFGEDTVGKAAVHFNKDLRVVCQLQSACPYIEAANFVTPSGDPVVFPLDISNYLNTLMFKCSTKPGLSQVLTNLLDFEHSAIRSRRASQLRGGRTNRLGFAVGLTMREAMLTNRWCDGILIGCDDTTINSSRQSAKSNQSGHYSLRGSFQMPNGGQDTRGIVGDPDRVIQADDTLIFVSPTSNPSAAGPHADRSSDFAAMAAARFKEQGIAPPFEPTRGAGSSGAGVDFSPSDAGSGGQRRPPPARRLSTVKEATQSSDGDGSFSQKEKHLILCGWREEWNTDPARFRRRVRGICDDLPTGSTVTCGE